MSYQALASQEDGHSMHEEPPRYNGQHNSATAASTSSKRASANGPSYYQAVNYVHTSDVGDIIGTVYHIDTDKPAAYGRFDTQEEQDQAPNVYLSAKNIAAEIRLSGSKKARIEIQGCTTNSYGRSMIRIVDEAKPLADGTPGPPTHFSINVSATAPASAVVAVPASFSGSINGACSLSGSIRDEAICLVADAKKSRWTVRQDYDANATGSTSAVSSQYPPTSNDTEPAKPEDGDAPPSNVPEHSSVSYTLLEANGTGDKSGKMQRERRHVVYDSDYGLGLQHLENAEKAYRKITRKALLYYFLACFGWSLLFYLLVAYFDGPAEAFWAFTLMPIGVSIIFPVIVIGESWTLYHYKPPLSGSV